MASGLRQSGQSIEVYTIELSFAGLQAALVLVSTS